MLPFKPYKNNQNHIAKENFASGTLFEDIVTLYNFDRRLRLIIFKKVEQIEISIRTNITYYLSNQYNPHWQDNPDIFKSNKKIDIYSAIQSHITKELQKNKTETFIMHYREKYYSPKNPPSWMCTEIMYLSHISMIFQNLKLRKDRMAISQVYNLPENIFASWIHTINYVRNICAHYSRLWNREFQIVPKLFKTSKYKWIDNPNTVQRSRVYYFISLLVYILDSIDEEHLFRKEVKEFINEYPDNYKKYMGFPLNWMKDDFWK